MKTFIANVVTKDRFEHTEIFNVVDGLDKVDNDLPILIIGWENALEAYPETSILKSHIKDDIFWTHRRTVKRSRYNKDILEFKKFSLDKIRSKVKFCSISLFTMSFERFTNMVNYIKGTEDGLCYFNGSELYVYCPKCRKVIGIPAVEADYMGVRMDSILSDVRSGTSKFIESADFIPEEIRGTVLDLGYMVPYLYFIFSRL